jgi:hypothetical protein
MTVREHAMIRFAAQLLATLVTLSLLVACGSNEAPTGKWEGYSESAHWLLGVRLKVDPGNVIHATALSINVTDASLPERQTLSDKMHRMMPEQWETATRSKVDFRDNVIHKAGGFAPLFIYDPKRGTMTFTFYAGGKLTEHVKLQPVKKFMDED